METDRPLIVVPTYNERENVGHWSCNYFKIAPRRTCFDHDDNSADDTVAFAQKIVSELISAFSISTNRFS